MITVTLYFKSICMACQNNLQSGQTLFQRLPHRLTEKQRSIFMPNLFLSPSVQEYNPYINGLGSEEYYMNLVADAMEPYLISCGISFTIRMTPCSRLLLYPMLETTISIWPSIPTPHHRPSPDSFKGATFTITPPAPREHAPRRSLQKT